MPRSTLTKQTARRLLAQARRIKEKTGAIHPCLFYVTTHNLSSFVPLMGLPDDAPARRMYFAVLGRSLPPIQEAIFLCEMWFLSASKGTPLPNQAPREHPARREGILLAGRDRKNVRQLFALQAFQEKDGRILWQPPDLSLRPDTFTGLLDCLFAP